MPLTIRLASFKPFAFSFIVVIFLAPNPAALSTESQSPQIELSFRYPIVSTQSLTEQQMQVAIDPTNQNSLPNELPPYSFGVFPRILGSSMQSVKDFILNSGPNSSQYEQEINSFNYRFKELQLTQNTSLLLVEYLSFQGPELQTDEYLPTAIYIFENGISVGYCLLDQLIVNRKVGFAQLDTIKLSKRNPTATQAINSAMHDLATQKGLKKVNVKTIVYEVSRNNNDYSETYGVLYSKTNNDDNNEDGLVPISITIDGFFPKKYSQDLLPYISTIVPKFAIQILNNK